MRFSLLTLLCLISVSAWAGYDKSWYQTEFWSGEWPNGVAVIGRNLKVPGRPSMDKDLKPSVECELPFTALFHPWNDKRNELSAVHYFTASRIVNLIAARDFTYAIPGNAGVDVPVLIKKGQIIEYLIYGAEGYFSARFNGKIFDAGQDLLENVEPVPDSAFSQEQWLNLTCVGGQQAWIFTGDLKDLPGLRDSVMGPGVTGYGHARDLTIKEAEELGGGKK
jgi:hypothetical protein